jgi:hypothetical protein
MRCVIAVAMAILAILLVNSAFLALAVSTEKTAAAATPTTALVLTPLASYESDQIPSSMVAGRSYYVSVRMTNTGGMAWSAMDGFRLGAAGDAASFGPGRVDIAPAVVVYPGQSYTFIFTMTAPLSAVTYHPSYRMVWEGHQWFGDTVAKTVAVAPVAPGAGYVSSNITPSMLGGKAYDVDIVMKNTGTMDWSEANHIRLGGLGDASGDTAKFSAMRLYIPPGVIVHPGDVYRWNFVMTAPVTAATYVPSYRIVWEGHQWFGDTVARAITVRPPSPNATVWSTTMPPILFAGMKYDVSVTMRNTGDMDWIGGSAIRLGAVGDASGDAAKFSGLRIYVPSGVVVHPGEIYTFYFTMTAPSTAGTYVPAYRMVWDGYRWFGDTASRTISVKTAITNSSFSLNTIPGSMRPGSSYSVNLTVTNTGNVDWTERDLFRLGALGDAAKFDEVRQYLPSGVVVHPGESYTFRFYMTAPASSGTYYPAYQMVWEGHQWFGYRFTKVVNVA